MNKPIKIIIETNALRSMGLGSQRFHELLLLISEDLVKVYLPQFVYQEFVKFKYKEALDVQGSAKSSIKRYERHLKNLEIDKKIESGSLFDENYILQEVRRFLDNRFKNFIIFDKPSDVQFYDKCFSEYFTFKGLFEGVENGKEHLLDTLIFHEISNKCNSMPFDFFIGNDKHLNNRLSSEIQNLQQVDTIESFLNLEYVKSEVDRIKNKIEGREHFDELIELLLFDNLLIDENLIWEFHSELERHNDTEDYRYDDVTLLSDTVEIDKGSSKYFGNGTFTIKGSIKANAYYQYVEMHDGDEYETSDSYGLECEFEIEFNFDDKILFEKDFSQKLKQWKKLLEDNKNKNMYAVAKGREEFFDIRSEINLEVEYSEIYVMDCVPNIFP
ncbi:hypothetical protein HBN50_12805 [Halobacteriovorax sp. GB3]|uniref:hypothetical protein n=1 Tax=Halobacteriovorax sp. GB3 TaxID=2719615 RepID=UPI0023612C58|nr:hypothetical protein [Halobacteriovorax sp. GB3]MDD0853984.1 hypothetical protein [Halobacteriovorax sp. GB3]